MNVSKSISKLILKFLSIGVWNRKIQLGIWSIKVFKSNTFITNPSKNILDSPTLMASDITDVSAEFVADPFIISKDSILYMFFEVLDKSTNKGIIGIANSLDGEKWEYDKIVLREPFHLSYPYVFNYNGEFYMIPESCETEKVLLYKSNNFPYEWSIVSELINGSFVDCSIFQYNNKWWMFGGQGGKLHLFYSDKLDQGWEEHSKSPLIKNNINITRPGGRVIVNNNIIYRYAQDGEPNYGSALRLFKIQRLSENEYEEEELSLIFKGTNKEGDWRRDGMHSIDQLKITDDQWLIAVDGHNIEEKNYLLWKFQSIISKK